MPKNRFVSVSLLIFAGLLLAACSAEVQPEAVLSVADDVVAATVPSTVLSAGVVPTLPHTSIPAASATQSPPATPTLIPTEIPPTAVVVNLPDLGAAPEITNEVWLNTDAPITLASVQGEKAVLVEFWTFG